jgi:Arylsulfotransferase (ASST)
VKFKVAAALGTGALCAAVASCSPGSTATATASTQAPPVTVLTKGADNGNGDIFLAPQGGGQYGSGPEIVSITGTVLWFHPLSAGTLATDFRTQTYLGKPVLTWFQGGGNGSGEDVIYNDRYQQIATVKPANGYMPDFHEFLITPWNTALILADTIGTANLTSLGLSAHQPVIDGVVQEIDIKTCKLLFQWDSAGHVPYSDSHAPMPQRAGLPWDWFHINAVHLDTDGNLLISSRFTWTIYKVNLRTGAMMWQLGGKHSTFTIKAAPGQKLDNADEIFAFQHDPEALGGNLYTVFDDESDGQAEFSSSRAVTISLNLTAHTATLIKSVNQPEGLTAAATGNAQTTRNGDLFVSWGGLSYFSEFSATRKLLFNAKLPDGVSTYRAYRLPWNPGN